MNGIFANAPTETQELMRFNRQFRKQRGLGSVRGLVENDAQRKAILSLFHEHGYASTEIGVMLGISRERVRQILKREGYESEKMGRCGSYPRLWDEQLQRFRLMTREEYERTQRVAKRARTRKRREDVRRKYREEHMRVFRPLAREGSVAPAMDDLARALGKENVTRKVSWGSSILHHWRERRGGLSTRHGGRTWLHGEATEAYHRLCTAMGWIPREVGGRGHKGYA